MEYEAPLPLRQPLPKILLKWHLHPFSLYFPFHPLFSARYQYAFDLKRFLLKYTLPIYRSRSLLLLKRPDRSNDFLYLSALKPRIFLWRRLMEQWISLYIRLSPQSLLLPSLLSPLSDCLWSPALLWRKPV